MNLQTCKIVCVWKPDFVSHRHFYALENNIWMWHLLDRICLPGHPKRYDGVAMFGYVISEELHLVWMQQCCMQLQYTGLCCNWGPGGLGEAAHLDVTSIMGTLEAIICQLSMSPIMCKCPGGTLGVHTFIHGTLYNSEY